MAADEKILAGIICIVVAILLAALSCAIFIPHEFQGYYMAGGQIWASYSWEPDVRAMEFTPERWQKILDCDLHMKISK